MLDFGPDQRDLLHLLAVYGYLAIFVLLAVESSGVPVPGETMLIVASIYAGTSGELQIPLVIAAAVAGAIIGDNAGYLLGREGGYRFLRRYGRYIFLDERRLELGQYLFERHGGKLVFFGRFLPLLRMWAAFLAGANRMEWKRFLLFNAAGGLLWASSVGILAYAMGDIVLKRGGWVAGGIVAMSLLCGLTLTLVMRRKERTLMREMEVADDAAPSARTGS